MQPFEIVVAIVVIAVVLMLVYAFTREPMPNQLHEIEEEAILLYNEAMAKVGGDPVAWTELSPDERDHWFMLAKNHIAARNMLLVGTMVR